MTILHSEHTDGPILGAYRELGVVGAEAHAERFSHAFVRVLHIEGASQGNPPDALGGIAISTGQLDTQPVGARGLFHFLGLLVFHT